MHQHQNAQPFHRANHCRRLGPYSECTVFAVSSTMKFIRSCALVSDRAQLELAAAVDHIVKHRVQRELVLSGPLGDHLPNLRSVLAKERGRREPPAKLRIGGKQTMQFPIVGLRRIDGVKSLLLLIIFGKRDFVLVQRIGAPPPRHLWPLLGDFRHQLVDVLELAQRRPAGVAVAPVRARRQPDRERLGEILVGMALRVPQPQMLDVVLAGRIGPVVARIALRRAAEQLLPAAAPMQLIGQLHDVSRLVAQDAHAVLLGAAFDIDDHLAFEPGQPRMRQIERDRDARCVGRAEPFVRDPDVRLEADASLLQLVVEVADAAPEPGAFNLDLEVLEPHLQQLLVGQAGPGYPARRSTRHGVARPRLETNNSMVSQPSLGRQQLPQFEPVRRSGGGAGSEVELRRAVQGRRAGGESGIRTHDTVSRIHAFQACAFSHSAISPHQVK